MRALALGVAGYLVGLRVSGSEAAFGAAAGSVAAGVYGWSYLASHLDRLRSAAQRGFDATLAGRAMLRLVLLTVAGAAMFLTGRAAFVGYLGGFAVTFAVLMGSEIPRVARELRARGSIPMRGGE